MGKYPFSRCRTWRGWGDSQLPATPCRDYPKFASQDLRPSGPNPWKTLRRYPSTKRVPPGHPTLGTNLVQEIMMETGCTPPTCVRTTPRISPADATEPRGRHRARGSHWSSPEGAEVVVSCLVIVCYVFVVSLLFYVCLCCFSTRVQKCRARQEVVGDNQS